MNRHETRDVARPDAFVPQQRVTTTHPNCAHEHGAVLRAQYGEEQ
jgi:hypothetical protein